MRTECGIGGGIPFRDLGIAGTTPELHPQIVRSRQPVSRKHLPNYYRQANMKRRRRQSLAILGVILLVGGLGGAMYVSLEYGNCAERQVYASERQPDSLTAFTVVNTSELRTEERAFLDSVIEKGSVPASDDAWDTLETRSGGPSETVLFQVDGSYYELQQVHVDCALRELVIGGPIIVALFGAFVLFWGVVDPDDRWMGEGRQ